MEILTKINILKNKLKTTLELYLNPTQIEEINEVLDELLLIGVKATNIFLSGHSAGGWSSLMSMNMVGKKFNAGILFAPACCGPRSEILVYPSWRKRIRPAYIKNMTNVERIEALIFSYKDDPYNRPRDLLFIGFRSHRKI